jgi:hypothetical protein
VRCIEERLEERCRWKLEWLPRHKVAWRSSWQRRWVQRVIVDGRRWWGTPRGGEQTGGGFLWPLAQRESHGENTTYDDDAQAHGSGTDRWLSDDPTQSEEQSKVMRGAKRG